jgi:hypothetical protein
MTTIPQGFTKLDAPAPPITGDDPSRRREAANAGPDMVREEARRTLLGERVWSTLRGGPRVAFSANGTLHTSQIPLIINFEARRS